MNKLVKTSSSSDLFDWEDLRDRHFHLLILGESGSGKTWLGDRLSEFLGGDLANIAGNHANAIDYLAETVNDRLRNRDKAHSLVTASIDEYHDVIRSTSALVQIQKIAQCGKKVGVRLIFLSQRSRELALPEECFTVIRLGKYAEQHAYGLARKQINNISRPCLVGDRVADMSFLGGSNA